MKGKDPQHSFLSKWLEEFSASRCRAVNLVNGLIDRIATELGLNAEEIPHQIQAKRGWLSGTGRITWQRIVSQLRHDRSQLDLFCGCEGRKFLVVADTKRISHQFDVLILSSIFDKLYAMGGDGKLDHSDSVLVFSPNLFIDQNEAWKDVYTVGYLSLLIIAFRHPRLIFTEIFGYFKKPIYIYACLFGIASKAFQILLSESKIKHCVMLTSNSYIVEMMRWSAVESSEVQGVVEILHGIPTMELIDYMESMIKRLRPEIRDKLYFVHPVSGLALSAPQGRMTLGNIILNLRIDEYIRVNSLNSTFSRLTAGSGRGRCYRVSLNGGADHSINYGKSLSFLIENRLISIIKDYAIARSVCIEICYSVHPNHYKSGISDELVDLVDVDIIFDDSVDSWLTSDLCISLFSSSAWDALHVGCPALIMANDRDNLYSDTLLGQFGSRGSGSTEEMLRDALQKMMMEPPIGTDVIKMRLEKVFEGSRGKRVEIEHSAI